MSNEERSTDKPAGCEASKRSDSLSARLRKSWTAAAIGLPALVAFGYFTDWRAMVALFFVMWADNLDKGR